MKNKNIDVFFLFLPNSSHSVINWHHMMQITFDIKSHEITFSLSLISARLRRSDSLSHVDLNVLVVAVLNSSADTFRFLIENSTLKSFDAYRKHRFEAQQLFLLSCGSQCGKV